MIKVILESIICSKRQHLDDEHIQRLHPLVKKLMSIKVIR